MSDIDRQAAIDALTEYGNGQVVYISVEEAVRRIEQLPPAQAESCEDTVSREAVSEWLKQYGQDVLHEKYKLSLMYIWKNLMELPSVQPDVIHCKDCIRYHEPTCLMAYDGKEWSEDDGFCHVGERRTDAD